MDVTCENPDIPVSVVLERNDFPGSVISFKNPDSMHLRLADSADNLSVVSC